MSSKCDELLISNNSLINTITLSSDSSLLDILNQQSYQPTDEDDSTSVIFIEDIKPHVKQTHNSESNGKINKNNFLENDKLSTLFNPTGRERNSTGPLKQWLYDHQNHPYPKESDKQELMKQTNMSSSQITIWFTNARVKMRKENKLLLKTKKTKPQDDFNPLDELIAYHNDLFSCRQFVIAYSCLNSQQIIDLHRLVSLYPKQFSISNCVDDHTTHLIIEKEENLLLCPLTIKLFQSIARHLYIITFRWITECLKQNDIVDELNYEIRGDIPFGEYHDGMRNSRLSKHVKLFENCHFFILCNNCQEKMSKDELISLIKLCHGSLLDTFPLTITANDKSILTIVICNKLFPFNCSVEKQLFELSHSNGVHFLQPEWILESIVQFNLQPFNFYEEKFS